ncbi:LOW QUALITY PROTEIN: myelin and lymphocyte protein-like [Cottoperca gobio]|uniref:LOW QUALITY PROTEIN: myelin and lymphocyte protein-like n=1 Tax=Cottoperca gobio TaxID=56716 RepID=A0A6J2PHM1_COTGO|nr:LOW QUALITY PROTEIN: myelin and lymphocyte protein-like [Cottoperca gobio]
MASNTATMGNLPSGIGIVTTIPDILYLPELIFGGLVWILVACTLVVPANPQGWVMFVSVFCFTMTFIWVVVFACGVHHNRGTWATVDVAYHGIAAFFYLSASVALAKVTLEMKNEIDSRNYKLDISAVVFSYVATFLYFIHTILSAIRWKSF